MKIQAIFSFWKHYKEQVIPNALCPVIFFPQGWSEKYIQGAADHHFIYKHLSHGYEAKGIIVEVGNSLCPHPCD